MVGATIRAEDGGGGSSGGWSRGEGGRRGDGGGEGGDAGGGGDPLSPIPPGLQTGPVGGVAVGFSCVAGGHASPRQPRAQETDGTRPLEPGGQTRALQEATIRALVGIGTGDGSTTSLRRIGEAGAWRGSMALPTNAVHVMDLEAQYG